MKTTGKLLVGTGIAAAVGFAAFLIYRRFKKEKKVILKAKTKEDAELKKLGIDPDYIRDEIIEEVDDNNLVKQLFIACYGSPEFDSDIFTQALDPDPEEMGKPLTYVMQSEFKGKKSLDLYLEIPYLGKKSFLSMRDFALAGKKLARDLWDDVKFVDEPHCALRGIMILEYAQEPDGEKIQRAFRLPEFLHSSKEWTEESKTGGLEEFITALQEKKKSALSEFEKIPAWLAENRPIEENFFDLRLVNVFLTYKISFNIADENKEPSVYKFGVDLKMGINILKFITHQFNVLGLDREGKVRESCPYDRLIFCAPGRENEWSFLRHYDKDREGHVYIDEFYWD